MNGADDDVDDDDATTDADDHVDDDHNVKNEINRP